MSQDALERLRYKAKPKVESRELSTIPPTNETEDLDGIKAALVNSQNDVSNSSNQDIEISTPKDSLMSSKQELDPSCWEIETKQSTIRLEKQLSQKLFQQCQQEEISREVFIEALFIYYENHKTIQSKVLQEARKRDEQRQEIANYRRAKSMIERFGKR